MGYGAAAKRSPLPRPADGEGPPVTDRQLRFALILWRACMILAGIDISLSAGMDWWLQRPPSGLVAVYVCSASVALVVECWGSMPARDGRS